MEPRRARILAAVRRADSAQLGQCAAGCAEDGIDVGGGFGDAAVEVADLGHEGDGQAAWRRGGRVAGSYLSNAVADGAPTA